MINGNLETHETRNNFKSGKKGSEKPSDMKKSVLNTIESETGFNVDEILAQMKDYGKIALDFAKKRPVLVIAAACAVGVIGAWALTGKKSEA